MKRRTTFALIAAAGALLSASAVCAGLVVRKHHKAKAKKPVLLVVSFGTSYNENRYLTLGAVEAAMEAAYPGYEIRRAFTSQMIIHKLRERDGEEIDSVPEAMERLLADGVREVVVQSTHVTPGFEFDEMVEQVSAFEKYFDRLTIGRPVLDTEEDYHTLARILAGEVAAFDGEDTAIVWMGHGTAHEANAAYERMAEVFGECGCMNHFVGTVEAKPDLEDVLAQVKEAGVHKVVLVPLMMVAGDHANNDMAGDGEDSWKSVFTREGFAVTTVMKGMGQYEGVRQLLLRHAWSAMKQ